MIKSIFHFFIKLYNKKLNALKVETHRPILKGNKKIIRKITTFWDKTTEGWHEIWGPHIHHGFYEDNERIEAVIAQEKLIDKLVALLELKPGAKILDVGCGMGGSSLYLAEKYQAEVTGITLSDKQLKMAYERIPDYLRSKIRFQKADAHTMENIGTHSFDIVWSLESCEQFYNKELFIIQALRVLKKGGKLMIATWCADQDYYEGKKARKYLKLCRSFDLPYTPSINQYLELITYYATIITVQDWSRNVKKSWQYGITCLKSHSRVKLLKLGGFTGFKFIRKLNIMKEAFQTGQLRYGVFIAEK